VRSRNLSPGRLALTLGLSAVALAVVLTLYAEAAGDPIRRVVYAPGVFVAGVIAWVWPEIERGGGPSPDLLRKCNVVVLSVVFFGVFRWWAFRKRRG